MQNIVVDREEDGKAVIQYLKRRDGGRATILPLSSIRPGFLREGEALSREPGFVGVGDQLISFDPKYQNVLPGCPPAGCSAAPARWPGSKFRRCGWPSRPSWSRRGSAPGRPG